LNTLERAKQEFERLVDAGDFASDSSVSDALRLLRERRALDLSFLSPREQADLIGSRSVDLLPSVDELRERTQAALAKGAALHVKFGIDPTSPNVHIGHAVPMILMSRFQRMGHRITLIIGDITASIGDPSGQSDERPALTLEEIASNLATYKNQISPFFDFAKARLCNNSEWLADYRLTDLLPLLAKIPVAQSMQRDDFRSRLSSGQSLTMAEQLYSVVMALDSVELDCDVEVGGLDQLLNMQMCRTLMAASGQKPEIVCTVPLIEGTDGSGQKMSKSRGNYVAMTDPATEIYGKLMSIPDRLIPIYLAALTELTDAEIERVQQRLGPRDAKHLLAATIVDTVHGPDAAIEARRSFLARFKSKRLSDATDVPVTSIDDTRTVGELLIELAFSSSLSHSRRVADQDGLQLVVERGDGSTHNVKLGRKAVDMTTAQLLREDGAGAAPHGPHDAVFLKLGRRAARLQR
jgi:tyrosyl-tRNA synthetase